MAKHEIFRLDWIHAPSNRSRQLISPPRIKFNFRRARPQRANQIAFLDWPHLYGPGRSKMEMYREIENWRFEKGEKEEKKSKRYKLEFN